MKSVKKANWIFAAILLLLVLTACGSGVSTPQPGVTIAGPLELTRSGSNASMGGGVLEITITDDGTGIASAGFTVSDLRCSSESLGIETMSGGWSTTTDFIQTIVIDKASAN